MATQTLLSVFPVLPVTFEATFSWEAWAPDWSGQVGGVVIRDPVLYGTNLIGGAGKLAIGPFKLTPGPGA
jgi:hypothetical protein